MAAAWLKTSPQKRSTLARVSFEAEAIWHMVNLYCADVGNDGRLPVRELAVACQRKLSQRKAEACIPELVDVGLWLRHDAELELVDWLKDQPAAEVWADNVQRERWARRKALNRDRATCNRVQERDANRCRYCGIRVNWADKKGAAGGTYDHVDPDKGNDLTNVVVACRRCNGRKKDRTPGQAGMPLLRPGSGPIAGDDDPDSGQIATRPDPDRGPNPPRTRSRDVTNPDRTEPETGSGLDRHGPAAVPNVEPEPPPHPALTADEHAAA